ncbi:hypothetical protein LSTR_LSTR006762 [Laodelphax striatellus]|uniref:Peptidase S1 domain-containing protein n=1 Tax=Laodelphax striatellus TaxID=195883 RepID=A0A482XDK1_LAOST|nr:hypothetical protein LSTR_LSTR006762 [Laodelphax striatellus]
MRVGEYDLRQNPDCDLAGFCAPSAKEYLAFKVSIHPDYIAHDPEDPAFPYNPLADIAVVRIDGEFIFSDFVLPICLEYGDLLKQDYAGEIAETIGWGVWGVDGNKLQNPKILQKVSLEVLNVSICSEILKEIPESYICAGTQTQFSYSGDSGSPIFIAKSVDGDIPRQYQIGLSSSAFALDITSWYGGKPPNGYTRVSYFLEWILDQIQD